MGVDINTIHDSVKWVPVKGEIVSLYLGTDHKPHPHTRLVIHKQQGDYTTDAKKSSLSSEYEKNILHVQNIIQPMTAVNNY